MSKIHRPALAASLLALATLAGCAEHHKTAAASPTLYERLGKKKAVTAVVDNFVDRVAADTRINSYFARTDLKNLRQQLVDQICQASGGPCTYKGGDMKRVHEGLGVTNPAFDALVSDLVAALDQFHVGATEKDELLAVLGPMRKDIVEK